MQNARFSVWHAKGMSPNTLFGTLTDANLCHTDANHCHRAQKVEIIMQEQKNELRGDSRTASLDSGTLSRKVSNYERLFLQPVKTAALHGKAIYVRPEFHQRIQRIVRLLDNDKISMYSYLDRVLEHHFATFDDEITAWCRNRFQALSRDLKTTLPWE